MEFNNEEEARRLLYIASKKLSENDYNTAKEFLIKAQVLYPNLDGLEQVLMIINVYISAGNKIKGGEEPKPDWYGVLGVDSLADDETIKKQYKKLALLIHPDKNKFNGAEGAFKLVLEAYSLLSDQTMRDSYDRKRKLKQFQKKEKESGMYKPPKPKRYEYEDCYYPDDEPEPYEHEAYCHESESESTFWTKCNRCETYCRYLRSSSLNKILPCPNCGQDFVATEILPEIINGRPCFRFSYSNKSTRQSSSNTSSSSFDSLMAYEEIRKKRWSQPKPKPDSSLKEEKVSKITSDPSSFTGSSSDSTKAEFANKTERIFKKANFVFETESLLEEEIMTTENANSTFEAERIFKKPMNVAS